MNESAGLIRRAVVELLGSAALATTVIGSGIAATNLTDDRGLQLFINVLSIALMLGVLIAILGPLSGAHLNPLVTAVDVALGGRRARDIAPYLVAQLAGSVIGAILANVMFAAPAVSVSTQQRATPSHLLAEVVATAGLIVTIFALARVGRGRWAPVVVAAYVGSAIFFTSSASFANPTLTIGRMLSDSFAGVAPASGAWFIAAQLVGAAVGYLAVRLLVPRAAT